MKKLFCIILSFFLLFGCFCFVAGADNDRAEDLTSSVKYTAVGCDSPAFLFDGNTKTYRKLAGNASVDINSDTPMAALYIMLAVECGEYTVTNNTSGVSETVGKYGYVHEFIDLISLFGEAATSVTVTFPQNGVKLSEISVFSQGVIPSYVQKWLPPLEGDTDLMLLAAHSDDDQLFFAGLLPHYAVYEGCNVQVAYLTDHRNLTEERVHEVLDGLWSVGITAYPVLGKFADFRIDSLEGTYDKYAQKGTSREQLLEYVVTLLRRFKPLVTVTHDFNGEYGHGMHMVYADLVKQALPLSGDKDKFPAVAEEYGTWEVQKAYFHLYEENQIVMDFDTPRECFGGVSAFNMSQHGFEWHVSQHKYNFYQWLNGDDGEITKATQIEKYNPCLYGLYYTSVGEDVNKNDLLENVVWNKGGDTDEGSSVFDTSLNVSDNISLESSQAVSDIFHSSSSPSDVSLNTENDSDNGAVYAIISVAVIALAVVVMLFVRKK